MAISPITGNEDLDAYLYDLSLQIGEAASSGSMNADENTGEITTTNGTILGYIKKYIHIKYADDYSGNGFTGSPLNKNFYGIQNSDSVFESSNPANYTWRETSGFGEDKLLYYRVESGRRIDFILSDVDVDGYDYDNGDAIDLDLVAGLINQSPLKEYTKKYLKVRYADSVTPTTAYTASQGRTFWGIAEVDNPEDEPSITEYRWTRAKTEEGDFVTFDDFGNNLYFWTRGGRALAFQVEDTSPDPSIWARANVNIKDTNNPYIDLDIRSGLVVTQASSPGGDSNLPHSVDPITGVVTYAMLQTLPADGYDFDIADINRITTDEYGRVVSLGFLDQFFAASEYFTATSDGQTFSFTHIANKAIYFRNGLLLGPSEFSETATTVTVPNIKNGDSFAAFRFRFLPWTEPEPPTVPTQYEGVPFTIESYTLSPGQNVVPVVLTNNSELLFGNGVFFEDYAYTIKGNGNIELAKPVVFNTVFYVYKFALRNGFNPVFSQGLSLLEGTSITYDNSMSTRGLFNFANGLTLTEDVDYVLGGNPKTITLNFTPNSNVGLIENTSFISYGNTEWNGVPKATQIDYTLSEDIAGPKEPPTLRSMINELRSQIINLTNEIDTLKGNT